ncbi:hypothetical protein ACH5RR_017755 [Cinchona calisaya]|uniref:Bulb-type lectin domain-containing protein n=1 Tax=Cinchona calisaya TaxID=153742 RepID=A0ABD2ZJG5_9GENT
MWYKIVPERSSIVWVANKGNALSASDLDSGLMISSDGNLKLIDGKQNTVWSTNASVQSNSTIAVLTDKGDFKLKDNVSGNDPAPGKFVAGLSDEKPPQAFIWNGTKPYWRGGPWDGWKFIGIEDAEKGYANGINLTPDNQMETVSLSFNTLNNSYVTIFTIKPSGVLEIYCTRKDNKFNGKFLRLHYKYQ